MVPATPRDELTRLQVPAAIDPTPFSHEAREGDEMERLCLWVSGNSEGDAPRARCGQ